MGTIWRLNGIRLGNCFQETWLVPSSVAAGVAEGEFEVLDRHEARSLVTHFALSSSLRTDLGHVAHRLDGLGAIPRHMGDQEILSRVRDQIDRGALVILRSLREPAAVDLESLEVLFPEEPFRDDYADQGPNVYDGKILGPAGPLPRWPFLLKKDGVTIDERSLEGSTSNKYQNGAWVSGRGGEFHFENLPEASYAIEVLIPSGDLIANRAPAPAGVDESGLRAMTPELDRHAFSEDPVDLLAGEEAA
jgi:hypothetical protein